MRRPATALACLAAAVAVNLPEYCAKTDGLEGRRRVPPLSPRSQAQHPKLLQVQTFIRHGARTPSTYVPCWSGYEAHWDCEVVESGSGGAESEGLRTIRFVKFYDALPEENVLNGTCLKGQLLVEGMEQHSINGRLFAEAYLVASGPHRIPADGAPPLLDVEAIPVAAEAALYFRSTDMQRTRVSGATFISSALRTATNDSAVLDFAIPLHTMDLGREYMFPNPDVCPILTTLERQFYESKERQKLLRFHAPLIAQLSDLLQLPDLQETFPGKLLDCLMTEVCSERPGTLPAELQPGTKLFRAATLAVEELEALPFVVNESAFSRAGLGRFFGDVREAAAAAADSYGSERANRGPLVFAPRPARPYRAIVWSGHDTTLMPLLMAIKRSYEDKQWPPYASTVTFELYEVDEEFYFRLVYNGEVATPSLEGCGPGALAEGELCPLEAFLDATAWAVNAEAACGTPAEATRGGEEAASFLGPVGPEPESSVALPVGATLAALGAGFVFGVVVLHLIHRKWTPRGSWPLSPGESPSPPQVDPAETGSLIEGDARRKRPQDYVPPE